jgi:hypothetical protein
MIRPLKMINLVPSFNYKRTPKQFQRTSNVPRVKFVLNGDCGRLVKKRRLCDEISDINEGDEDETGKY